MFLADTAAVDAGWYSMRQTFFPYSEHYGETPVRGLFSCYFTVFLLQCRKGYFFTLSKTVGSRKGVRVRENNREMLIPLTFFYALGKVHCSICLFSKGLAVGFPCSTRPRNHSHVAQSRAACQVRVVKAAVLPSSCCVVLFTISESKK